MLDMSNFVSGFWRLKNWGMNSQEVLTYIENCLELGIDTTDHAIVYGSEKPFGEALALKPALRGQLKIVTKYGIRPKGMGVLGAQKTNHYDSCESTLIRSVEQSLNDLQTDYIDLLLIHRPDYLMDCEMLARSFEVLRTSGKVRFFGVSNFSTDQLSLLQSYLSLPLQTNQIEFSPYSMQALENGQLNQCYQLRIKPMLWSSLGAGSLLAPQDDKGHRILNALTQVGQELGASPEQTIYAWINSLPTKPRILLGSSKISRIRAAVAATKVSMSREQWYTIWEASNGQQVP